MLDSCCASSFFSTTDATCASPASLPENSAVFASPGQTIVVNRRRKMRRQRDRRFGNVPERVPCACLVRLPSDSRNLVERQVKARFRSEVEQPNACDSPVRRMRPEKRIRFASVRPRRRAVIIQKDRCSDHAFGNPEFPVGIPVPGTSKTRLCPKENQQNTRYQSEPSCVQFSPRSLSPKEKGANRRSIRPASCSASLPTYPPRKRPEPTGMVSD